MSWITEPPINPADLEALAAQAAEAKPGRTRASSGGRLTGIIGVMSLNPRALKGVRDMNSAITFGASVLTRVQEESIATVVANANSCRY
jgi:hypothetical protein